MLNWTPIVIWMATYWLHSTFLLGSVWVWVRVRRPSSHALRDYAWKSAALGGILTASLQLGLGIETPTNQTARALWQFQGWTNQATTSATASELIAKTSPRLSTGHSSTAEPSPLGPSTVVREQHPNLPGSETVHGLLPTAKLTSGLEFEEQSTAHRSDLGSWRSPVVNSRNHFQFVRDDDVFVDPALVLPSHRLAVRHKNQVSQDRAVSPRSQSLSVPASFSTRTQVAQWLTRWTWPVAVGLSAALLTWSVCGGLKLIFNHIRFLRRMSGCAEFQHGPEWETLQNLLAESKISRPIRLFIGDDQIEPGAWGIFQWRIVLPSRVQQSLSGQDLRALLAHELAHLVRGDQFWIWTGHLLSVCLSWQPLNGLAFREWRKTSEFLADAWAINHNVSRLSLARCLLEVAEWRFTTPFPIAAVGGSSRSTVTLRIEHLLGDQPMTDPWLNRNRRKLLAAVAGVLGITMICYAPTAAIGSHQPARLVVTPVSTTPSTSRIEAVARPDRKNRRDDRQNVQPRIRRDSAASTMESGRFEDRFQTVVLDLNQHRIHSEVLLLVWLAEFHDDLLFQAEELPEFENFHFTNYRIERVARIQTQVQQFRVSFDGATQVQERIFATFEL